MRYLYKIVLVVDGKVLVEVDLLSLFALYQKLGETNPQNLGTTQKPTKITPTKVAVKTGDDGFWLKIFVMIWLISGGVIVSVKIKMTKR